MQRIRFLILLLAVGVSTPCFAPSALGWEFNMEASFNWINEWYDQQGHSGFFGPYNVDNGPGTTANLNFWNGAQFDTNMTTSASARWSYFWVEFNPRFQINPAIRLTGKYRLGTYGVPLNVNSYTQNAPGTNTAFSDGQWTMFLGYRGDSLGRVRNRKEAVEIRDRPTV